MNQTLGYLSLTWLILQEVRELLVLKQME